MIARAKLYRKKASPQLSMSGYQCQFVDSVEDYECPLCLHVTREPFLTSCCGQHFCQICINRILTDNKPCPICKSTSFSTLLDKKQKRKVLSLNVYCDKKAGGCQWVGGLGELEQHLSENCQFVTVNCPNNCGQAFQRQFLAKHKTYDCPKRPHMHLPVLQCKGHLPGDPRRPPPCVSQVSSTMSQQVRSVSSRERPTGGPPQRVSSAAGGV